MAWSITCRLYNLIMFDKLLMAAAQPVAATDGNEHIANTELLLKGEGSNGQTNNTFVDSSASSHSITRHNDVTQGSFSPFSPKGWSGHFDGSDDKLTFASSTDFSLHGDFTFEAWVYRTSDPKGWSRIANWGDYWNNNTAVALIFDDADNADKITFRSYTGIGLVSSSSVSSNQWYHVAVTRSNNDYKLFIDGVLEASTTSSTAISSSSNTVFSIGSAHNRDVDEAFAGYISNARFVKGTALYTAAFTPPTEPLTAVTNTKLLTLQDNRFIENSASNHSITVIGDPAIKPTSPFSGNRTYPKASYFSGKFDGSNDYLEVAPGGFNKTNLGSSTATQGFVLGGQSSYVNSELRLCPNTVSNNGGMIKWQTPVKLNQDFSVFFKMNGSSPPSGTNLIAQGCSINFSSSNASYTGSHTMNDPIV